MLGTIYDLAYKAKACELGSYEQIDAFNSLSNIAIKNGIDLSKINSSVNNEIVDEIMQQLTKGKHYAD